MPPFVDTFPRQKLQIDIGKPSRAVRVTPPGVRVRTRRFGWLKTGRIREAGESERVEVGTGQGDAEGGAAAAVPRPVRAASGLGRQVFAHAPLADLREAGFAPFPLLPLKAPEPPAHPRVHTALGDAERRCDALPRNGFKNVVRQ